MLLKKSVFLLLGFAQSSLANPACPTPDKVVAINVAFQYFTPENVTNQLLGISGTGILNETRSDLALFNQITRGLAGKTHQVTDSSEAALTRQQFLSHLKSWTRDADAIHLNYAGHGVITSKGEWAIALPNLNNDQCAGESVSAKDLQAAINKRGLPAKLYRGIYGESFIKKIRGLVPNETTKSVVARETPQVQAIVEKVAHDLSQIPTVKDEGACAKYLVPISEIQQTVGDKNIYGIFDSCYSGAIQSTSNFSALTPVSAIQVAKSDPSGGVMTNKIRQNISLHNCRNAGKKMTMSDLLANSMNLTSSFSIADPETREVYLKGDYPTQGEAPTLSTNSATECFNYAQSEKDFKCPVPTRLKMKIPETTFNPYEGFGEERTKCKMNREENIDPQAIESSICPPRILLKGLQSGCTGWVRLSALTGRQANCSPAGPASRGSSGGSSR